MAQKQDKAATAEAKKARKAASKAKRSQLFQAFNMQRKEDKALIPLMLGVFVVIVGVAFGGGLLLGGMQWILLPVGIALGLLGAVILFGRRVQKNVYSKAEGQPGAAGWALDNMRGRWRVTSGVAATTQGDFVHRVLGRPGVVLVAEGAPHRVKNLLAQEKKRVARVVGDTPIYDFVVGNDENQVPLAKLQQRIMKLPNNLKPAQIDTIEKRMSALAARSAGAQMPKGPMPSGAKMRSVQRAMRRR